MMTDQDRHLSDPETWFPVGRGHSARLDQICAADIRKLVRPATDDQLAHRTVGTSQRHAVFGIAGQEALTNADDEPSEHGHGPSTRKAWRKSSGSVRNPAISKAER